MKNVSAVRGRDEIDEDDVDRALSRVGLGGFGERDTSTLSGGELQRLALASAIVREPALLISDESTAMLDPDDARRLWDFSNQLLA